MTPRHRLLCCCILQVAAMAVLIVAWPSTWGACAAGMLALAGVLLAPLDPP